MKKLTKMFLLSINLLFPPSFVNNDCTVRNNAFQAGESVTYKVYYKVAGVYVAGGEAVFSSTLETLNGKGVYHVVGDGKTNSFYDMIFKVRDKYESYIDTGSLKPYKFIRDANEGGHKIYENVTFNKLANTALTNQGVYKVPECVQDVISSIYYARNLDFSSLKPGDKIPFSMFLDNKVYDLYIRYLGKEVVKTKYGKFRAIKFKPLLIKGTIFQGGEKMVVWISDDANHIPLRVESPIIVGDVVVDMINFQNRRHPLNSLIDL
jgi:hypothetical protein